MREIVHLQVGQCGNQIGGKARYKNIIDFFLKTHFYEKNLIYLSFLPYNAFRYQFKSHFTLLIQFLVSSGK